MSARGAVVVTGASRGIGREIARALAEEGFTVFAGVRSRADGEEAARAHTNIRPLQLDVTQSGDIADAVARVSQATGGELAGLVNNAGVLTVGPVELVPPEEWERAFRVNVVGVAAVTRAFLPLIRSARGRIVNISSVNGELTLPFGGVYCATKAALEAYSDALRYEVEPWGVRVSVVQPGVVKSGIRGHGTEAWRARRERLDPEDAALYREAFERMSSRMEAMDDGAPGPEHVLEAVLSALTDEQPRSRYRAGPDWDQYAPLIELEDRERDAAFRSMLGGAGE